MYHINAIEKFKGFSLKVAEEDLTDLDPGEPTICVTATVKVKDWDIVPVEPEYGK